MDRLTESEVAEYEALKNEKQAYSDGWRTRVELGDIDAWESDEKLLQWNEAANKNPHKWNTPLYERWRAGFLHNDTLKRFNMTIEELGKCREENAELLRRLAQRKCDDNTGIPF